jgi:O-antigen/teichoic acid export membrane protein
MKKHFISNLILLVTVNLLIKPFWILGVERNIQLTLGYEQYGIYAGLMAFSFLVVTLLDMGINTYAASTVAKSPLLLKTEFIPLTLFKVFTAVVYIGLTYFLAKLFNYEGWRIQLLLWIGLNQVLSYFFTFFRSLIGGLQLYKTDSLLSVADRSMMVLLCGFLLWGNYTAVTLNLFIGAQTIAYLVAIVSGSLVLIPHLKGLQFKVFTGQIKHVIKKTLPYALLSLVMTLYTRLDAVLIKQLLVDGDVQNGIYASSYRLLDACNMMVAMVSMLLLPMFSKMIADKQHPESLVELASAVMIVPATVIAFGAFFYKEALMKSMFPASSDQAYEVFGWIILSFIPMSMMYIYGTLLTANANLKTLIKYASIGLVINILLNLILIPPYKALGAAIATLSTQAFIGFSNFIAAKKELNLQFSTYFSKRFFVSIAFIFVCCLMTSIYVKSWFWGFLVIGTLSMAVTFSSKLLSLRSIGALLPLQADKIKDNQ